jgi:beta-galactosidase
MYGVTRHQDWWGLGSALTNREHDFDLAQIMDVGATTVRFAHYQQSEYLYSRCDTLGLIIWAEIPFVNRVTGYESENAQTQLRELIRQSFNHPSIYEVV